MLNYYNQTRKRRQSKKDLVSPMARIGLLEDNIRISKLCATMLNYAGHDVTVYASASECLSALQVRDCPLFHLLPRTGRVGNIQLPIDVLILDLHLPTMTGLELLSILRSCTHTCTLPLIFCTAATGKEIAQAFAIAPDATLVEKPFRLQALVSAISEVCPPSLQ
jgi:CheY-like chemotaxis protein